MAEPNRRERRKGLQGNFVKNSRSDLELPPGFQSHLRIKKALGKKKKCPAGLNREPGGGNSNTFYVHPEPEGRSCFSDRLVQPPTSFDVELVSF